MRSTLSHFVGWLSDRRVPRALRGPLYRAYSKSYAVDLSEVRLALEEHPSFGAFFVRRLKDGARAFPSDALEFPSPCDGTVQSIDAIENDTLLQAKGRPYSVRELLGGVASDVDFAGGHAWTIYLSPRDYHRVHTPIEGELVECVWLGGERFSVAPKVLETREKVLSVNERCVMRIESARGPLLLVMVGALNVGRIKVVGVESSGRVTPPRRMRRGDELARFEMGSTVVLVAPRGGPTPESALEPGLGVLMGSRIGRYAPVKR